MFPIKKCCLGNLKGSNRFSNLGFHERGNAVTTGREPFVVVFPIHARITGTTAPAFRHTPGSRLSIHAPMKRSTRAQGRPNRQLASFNPRSHEGSDPAIHQGLRPAQLISIHAPVKGATPAAGGQASSRSNFNPRSREGSDLFAFLTARDAEPISIHAPVKGATTWKKPIKVQVVQFQSTLP